MDFGKQNKAKYILQTQHHFHLDPLARQSVVNFTPKIMFAHWGFENGSIFALSFHLLPIFQ